MILLSGSHFDKKMEIRVKLVKFDLDVLMSLDNWGFTSFSSATVLRES